MFKFKKLFSNSYKSIIYKIFKLIYGEIKSVYENKESNVVDFEKIILYSNTMLENAIYIYKKHGFIEIPMEEKTPYKRSNIKMELVLNNPYKSTENN